MQLTADSLIEACGDESEAAGVVITSDLEPLAGPGAPVKPAIYEGGRYQRDRRWWGDEPNRRVVDVVVVDNVPSQANRLEAALLQHREALGLPDIVLDLSGIEHLPVHLPRRLSIFQFPHRNADAYLRDAELDGTAFPKSPVGSALFAATPHEPAALFEWAPQALLFGFWQSHLGKKRQQTKLARSWVSEVAGYEPAIGADETVRTFGLKGDPLNLSIDSALSYDEDDQLGWELAGGEKKKGPKSKDSLAEVGHGQVPVGSEGAAPAPVSFRALQQHASVSFAGLRRIWAGDPDRNATGRALLASLGVAAHVFAFGRAFSLRSGCDLRPAHTTWTWLGADEDVDLGVPTVDDAVALVRDCAAAAESAGLPVGSRWASEPLVLQPAENLKKAIRETWPLLAGEG